MGGFGSNGLPAPGVALQSHDPRPKRDPACLPFGRSRRRSSSSPFHADRQGESTAIRGEGDARLVSLFILVIRVIRIAAAEWRVEMRDSAI